MSRLTACLAMLFISVITGTSYANEIPKSLEEWKPWVLEKHPDINCPFLFNDAVRECIWPSELQINADKIGATFSQRVEVYQNDWVNLPGGSGFWPQAVTDNSSKIPVREHENIPQVYLTIGIHNLSGELHWNEMPRTLQIPSQTGIINLRLNGKTITNPAIENGDQLWLSANEAQTTVAHQDTFNIRVFRKVEDTIPLRITTLIQLDISGKERELQLGQFLLNGLTPTEFTSNLPARIEKDGNLRVQVKSGSWEITLVSQSNTPINDLTFKANSDLWPQEEIWVFAAERQLRSVQISGVQTVDPQQTQLPEGWKSLPAYLMTPETHFKIEELNRGENKDNASNLTLNRDAWLSFDSQKFIFRDQVSGRLQASRIETIDPVTLTNADISGKSQLITHLANSKNSGIEIRAHDIRFTGISELMRSFTLPITGWSQDFDSVSTSLHLPPGWSLITATGTSSESGSWISQWSLWDIFLVLVIVVAIGRTTKLTYGALAAITLIVIYQRSGAPIFIWLNLIATITLLAFVSGGFKNYLVKYTWLSFFLLAITLLPFAVREARAIINPQLENQDVLEFDICSIASCEYSSKKKTQAYAAARMETSAEPPAVAAPDQVEEIIVQGISATDTGKMRDKNSAGSLQRAPTVKINKSYLPNQQTQTGVAVPNWDQNRFYLQWNGPVKMNETTRLVLVSPFINRIGYLLSVILPLLLTGVLLRQFLTVTNKTITFPDMKKMGSAGAICILLTAGMMFTPEPVKADVPVDQELLKELEERLTAPPKCLPSCAAIESAKININNDQLTLNLIVHATDLISLPLPADHEQWWPTQVDMDGKSATVIKTDDQTLLVSLPKGKHELMLRASLQGRDNLNLEFPIALHNLSSSTTGWELSGAPTAEQASQSIQLQRVERSEIIDKSEHLRPDPIAPFVIVRREFALNLEWSVTTTVTRVAPAFGAINLEVPLIPGESPLTTQVNANGKISVHIEANQQSAEWNSTIKQVTPLQLEAAKNSSWVEIWVLNVSPIWHTDITGIAPIQLGSNENIPIWQPWPGESLRVGITRPEATKGSYITIDSANLVYTPSERSSTSELTLSIRSNQGGQYSFTLPKNTKLSSVIIDYNQQLLSATNNVLKIPLHPGTQNVTIKWTAEESISIASKSPSFSLDGGSSNQNINIRLPGNRWSLFVGGPSVGPSILIWGMLIVVVIISVALGRSGLTPLKTYEWILLSLGVCTQNFFAFIVIATWLLILQRRGQLREISSSRKFKWMQFFLFIFSLISLLALIGTIPSGLLGSPNMHIVGNYSYAGNFSWYQDHSDSEFPTAFVISLPLWCYKVVILLWALWLASALLNWIRWGWQQLNHNGLWNASAEIITQPATEKANPANNVKPENNNEPIA